MASYIRRRKFLAALGGAAAWPLAAVAQQPGQMRRIGVLMGYAESDLEAQSWVTAFVQGFKELGWIVGRNVSIDYRFGAGDADRMRVYAEELAGLAPAVILAHTSPVMAALQQATRTIPIVFVDVFAPVGQRFVSNLARPGGNITGFSSVEPEIGGKWLGFHRSKLMSGNGMVRPCSGPLPMVHRFEVQPTLRHIDSHGAGPPHGLQLAGIGVDANRRRRALVSSLRSLVAAHSLPSRPRRPLARREK
jgi:hypothetical protein